MCLKPRLWHRVIHNTKPVFLISLLLLGIQAVFAQQGVLNGIVYNEQGAPLAGATVRLEPDRHMLQTDNKGFFEIKKLFAGEYNLYISHTGYQPAEQAVSVPVSGKKTVTIYLQAAQNALQEVLVAGQAVNNNSPDNLLNIQRSAMPVTVITRQAIEKMGSRRLDEILKEQTGIAIVSDISGGVRATGIQMQGFGSEYVMILIDGQPITGRNSGNFDLSRISVANIERIEIVKGASSCLFGSDALGGAINIITRYGAVQPQARISLLYGSLNIADATAEGETPFHNNRGSANLSLNYYHSDGYNTDPQFITRGTTAPPYDDYAVQGRGRYRTSKNGVAGMSGRYALRRSYMEKKFQSAPVDDNASGDRQNLSDLNFSVYYNHHLSSALQGMSRYYFTRYESDMSVAWQHTGGTVSRERFVQQLHRFEQQFAYSLSAAIKFTGGLGGSVETMNSDAYTVPGNMAAAFTYLQADWRLTGNTGMVGGIRYDYHNTYRGKINPSVGIQQKIFSRLSAKLSVGSGFKAPDYKNRYQVFVNPMSNYMVIGTEALANTLGQMETAGEISEIRQYILKQVAGNLQPERSTSFNGGFIYKPFEKLKLEAGVFYHHLRNQINSIQVATGTGNRQIFTYQNLPQSVNKGIEASFSWLPFTGFELNGGYQYLVAKDKSVKDSISAGNYPWYKIRDNTTGQTWDSKPSDYWGIENRSRHMANLRAFYSLGRHGIQFSFRINYRGKYAFGDANNNNFIDRYDQFVEGFFLLNGSVEKRLLKDHLRLRLTADNLLNYTDRLMPAQPGRVILLGVAYSFYKD